ncbi:hypothetical protein HWV62_27003 [Athelia sp. TMB]|nr:hypothetical protein HWV62_27003 [Athelia sp. TMB]
MSQSDWTRVPAHDSTPAYSYYNKPIEKSELDDRSYRVIRLENGLNATVIHDPTADKAAASLDVAIGHLYDPVDMPGLAHFCEHLLFMGTESYPKENEYSEFLAKNNGSSNAYTGTSNTNYHFDVATPALTHALSRFAAFFHCPLFSPSCTSRELNAVDSEHKKNHQNDMWRIFQLNKHLSKDGHAWSKFGSGNRESLSQAGKDLQIKGKLEQAAFASGQSSLAPSPLPSRMASPAPSIASATSESEADGGAVGRETRRRLVEWWTKEYCASRMNLAVIGKESLDELAATVAKLFSPVPNRQQDALPMITDHPFGEGETGRLVSVGTVLSFQALEVSFPIPYQPPNWRYKPANFVSHFAGHEGPGSLHSYLKNKGWITSLSSGPQNLARGFAMFKVTAHLTKAGLQNYRAVILAVLKYLSLLRSSEFPAWYQREIAMMYQTRFRFKEKSRPESYAVWVAEHMSWPVPREVLLTAPSLVWEWPKGNEGLNLVKEMLNTLSIDRGRVVLMAKADEHARLTPGGKVDWSKEPIYGTDYKVEKLDAELIKEAQHNDIPELFLPGPNEFMPTNLDVDKRDVAEPAPRPHLIRETPLSSLWHKKDDQFWVPKAHVIIEIRTPFANDSARSAVLTRLYTEIVTDSLTEFSYDADLAGLQYEFASHSLGLWITLSGYNDKLPVLARHVLEKMKDIKVNPERLEVMKEQVKRDWENFFLGQSYRISDYYGRSMLTKTLWTLDEKLPEIPLVTTETLQQHIAVLLSKVNMRILINGNMYKDEAIRVAEMAESILAPSPIPSNEVVDRALILPEASNYIWDTKAPNKNEPNSALTYYLHFGDRTSSPDRVTGSLLIQILTEPAFNVLRTKEQLGYIVHCSSWVLSGAGSSGVRIVVQSEKGPAYLETRVDAFLDSMQAVMESMSEEEFAEQKDGLERRLTEKMKTVSEETNLFWSHIDSGYLDFLRRKQDALTLKSIKKDDVLRLFHAKVHPSSTIRSKLAVHCYSQKPRAKTVTTAAAEVFADLVRTSGIAFDENAWQEHLASDPVTTLPEFTKFWTGMFTELATKSEATEPLFGKLPAIVESHPAPWEEDHITKRKDVIYIDDVNAFKASLTASDDPAPLMEWNDLPISKY